MKQKTSPKVWILIPARGGSKGIPRKNIKKLNGIPLIRHVLLELSKKFDRESIIVSTDNSEIAQLSNEFAQIHKRSADSARDISTLDDVALEVSNWLLNHSAEKEDIILTIQPTSPFLTCSTVEKGIQLLQEGAKSVLTVVDDRHLRWTVKSEGQAKPLYSERVNRQWLPVTFSETGGIIGCFINSLLENGSRIQAPVALLEISKKEGLDIDTYADWASAEYYARRKKIVIRADASPQLGMGHVYRAIALAYELNEHDLRIVTRCDGDNKLGANFLEGLPYKITQIEDESAFFKFMEELQPHLAVLDVLDTTEEYVQAVKQNTTCVVSLEDLGLGARFADIVINDLYTDLYPHNNHWYGVKNAILAPQFETVSPRELLNSPVKTILLAFGGTDPQNLTKKALSALKQVQYPEDVIVVLGPGYQHAMLSLDEYGLNGRLHTSVENMALLMQQADLALTSGGRTVTELMTLGIPTIVLCQNNRELTHTHASSPYGVINLGLGEHVNVTSLANHISHLLENKNLRVSMRERALKAVKERSNTAIVQRILSKVFSSNY
ncbi:MAG: UDP-2,4-diacetamido-2,4,6-trideoxy-beta-L-altropyranose hydrolase [Chloroflexi bacterium]|nr:MAG: UDP-2,4-diacetamido-2,4,6-trideoxy-beta-L-altropyranose hydrolase [Chloroflexota bacterium]